ncbi:MAG: ferrous iron transporter B [Puniceicoccales bacterium]|jgi:ferrous iron transport protein B|nr:ferrous iron transporter B [Puniceicoccales bacterium]
MSCENCPLKKRYSVILVGNPNVGKSSVFNMLSEKYTEVSNYPGTSVDVARAKMDFGELVDTPGILDFKSHSQLTGITRKYVEKADVVVNVVSALTLDRDLILTQQLLGAGCNLILVANQVDEAEKRKIVIDYEKLSERLGMSIIKTVATKKIGRENVLLAIGNRIENLTCHPNYSACTEQIPGKCTSGGNPHSRISRKIDSLLLNPLIGWPVAIAILCALFATLGIAISGYIVDGIIAAIDKFYIPLISTCVIHWLGDNLLAKILIGEFGILTMEVKMIVGILLPLIAGFYVIMSLLEDSGYIPRLASISNKFFNYFGLNGNAVIPILLGFGCGAMGTISTRILETKKEKIIATALIGIGIPCSAQQGIIIALLASLHSIWAWLIYASTLLLVMLISGKTLAMFLREPKSNFTMELPPLRLPSPRNCLRKTWHRILVFLSESLAIFTANSAVITLLHGLGFLHWLQVNLSPVVENLLHLPREFSNIFVMGVIRRDFASVGVFEMARGILTKPQILTATVVVSLFVPCVNALMVIWKERGWRMACALWGSTFTISIAVGSILTRILESF